MKALPAKSWSFEAWSRAERWIPTPPTCLTSTTSLVHILYDISFSSSSGTACERTASAEISRAVPLFAELPVVTGQFESIRNYKIQISSLLAWVPVLSRHGISYLKCRERRVGWEYLCISFFKLVNDDYWPRSAAFLTGILLVFIKSSYSINLNTFPPLLSNY